MGKTKITTEKEEVNKENIEGEAKVTSKTPKKKITAGIFYVDATFNNTKVLFGDKLGNTLFWSSAGSLGFILRSVLAGKSVSCISFTRLSGPYG